MDEYDWIMFEGSVDTIINSLEYFQQAHKVIGFSGSNLSFTEENCLKLAFQATPVVFPTLDKL